MDSKSPATIPWDDLFFQLEDSNEAAETAQRTYKRYIQSMRAIIDSYDAPINQTPREEIWRLNKSKLYHYTPTKPADECFPIPLLLVYALINRPFIFDLVPGRSFVEFMLDQGFEIYLLDWGEPGPEDQDTTFDDYVTEYLTRVVRKVLRHSGADELSMLGYCIGATLSVVYAALYPEAPLRNMILLTAPIDFSSQLDGSMAMWLDEGRIDIDKLIDTVGNVPGELIRHWAKMLKPVENFVGSYVNLMKMVDDEGAVKAWQVINRWVEDVIPFSGEAFRQFVKTYLRGNKLIKGEHIIHGQPVDLANIKAPLFNIVAKFDHLVSQSQSESIMSLISSEDKELKVIPSTHVGIMISGSARYKLWPEIVEWLGERSI
ncbi:MAG: alpha/beta fold hydrolase [Anaerolineales bacterium]|nr:alpha/beta fold hydrolase [Chloroflexota bacterium]MBL6982748.1 alpha/beta fold hydrolase [Anaerolineales bacterium]